MKFIRSWLKTLIAEAIKENFPSMYLTVDMPNKKIEMYNCRFNNSQINIKETDPAAEIALDSCVIDTSLLEDKPFITRTRAKKKRK